MNYLPPPKLKYVNTQTKKYRADYDTILVYSISTRLNLHPLSEFAYLTECRFIYNLNTSSVDDENFLIDKTGKCAYGI